jgi:hypothetical protein
MFVLAIAGPLVGLVLLALMSRRGRGTEFPRLAEMGLSRADWEREQKERKA